MVVLATGQSRNTLFPCAEVTIIHGRKDARAQPSPHSQHRGLHTAMSCHCVSCGCCFLFVVFLCLPAYALLSLFLLSLFATVVELSRLPLLLIGCAYAWNSQIDTHTPQGNTSTDFLSSSVFYSIKVETVGFSLDIQLKSRFRSIHKKYGAEGASGYKNA